MVDTGGCVQDGVCLCFRTWVLVIHNDFDGIDKLNRLGDDVDVKNLRRVFETQRGCIFRELHNCGREEIVQTLYQEDKLIQLFNADDEEDSSPPAAFILFILSHGESGGVILTDHFKKGTDPADLKFETYTTNEVWNLAKIEFISSSLKLLFLGPCRGNLAEFKLKDDHTKENFQTLPGWLSSQPNKENFVILYATVESTMANRCELDGTWFVQAIYKELENLTVNMPLLDFLTRIQFHLCTKNAIISSDVGQTSQLHFFFHKKYTMCGKKNIIIPIRNIPLPPRNEQTDNYSQNDISATRSIFHWLTLKYDAKAGNLNGLLTFDKLINYDWLDRKNVQLKRGKAIIFHDRKHFERALKIGASLQGLGYTTSLHDVCNIKSIITKTCPKRGFGHDGSFVLCVLAQIFESGNGLMIKVANNSFLLSQIIDEYTGTKCTQLIGKPKLFFFLDNEPNIKTDGEWTVEIKTPVKSINNKYFNLHAGVCTFVGVRSGPKGSGGDVIENLIKVLGSPRLKEEGSSLQTVLSEVIAKSTSEDKRPDEKNHIKSQFLSTLPQFVDFTPLKSPYEQEKYNVFSRVFGAALLTSILFCILTIVLGLALRTPRLLLVNVDDSCGISFTGKDVPENDAFSLNSSEWSTLSINCSETWEQTFEADYLTIDTLKSNDSSSVQKAIQRLEQSENKRESLYRVILFGYSSANLMKLIQFSSLMDTPTLQLDGLRSIVSKVDKNCDFENIAVLELSHILKDTDKDLQIQLNNCTDTVVTKFCPKDHDLFKSLIMLSAGAQKQFVPLIIVNCFQNLTSADFETIILITRDLFPKIACSAYQNLLLEIENQKQLGSSYAFILRRYSERFNTSDQKQKQICINVTETLKPHFQEHAQPYLRYFDRASNLSQCSRISNDVFLTSDIIISYVVKMRYNGSWENAEKIQQCFSKTRNSTFICASTLALVKEFWNYNKQASFESLNVFSNVYKTYKNTVEQGNSYSTRESNCRKDLEHAAPFWIQEFMFDGNPVCAYSKDDNCTESVIQDLGSILTDIETRNLSKRHEILFVDFVLNSINKSEEVWRKVEPLVKRAEPLKKPTLDAMLRSFLDVIRTHSIDSLIMFINSFGSKVWIPYLSFIVHEAYLKKGIQGMYYYLGKMKVLQTYMTDQCDGIYSLYSAMMQQNIKNLNTIEALFLYKYTLSIPNRSEKCELVVSGLRNYSEAGMDKYESYFRQNTTESFQILGDLHRKYKDSSLWIIPQLIDRYISRNESFGYQILNFLQRLPMSLTKYNTCPVVYALSDKIPCNDINSKFCSKMCNAILPGLRDTDYQYKDMCKNAWRASCN